jgi:molybdate transport system substrate-binding protein
MKKIIMSLLFAAISAYAGEIKIAVAANVSYAIDELKAAFAKTHPDTTIQVILGSSGKLTAQIKNGAPFGLFMAANMKFPQALYDDEIATTKPIVYAQGALAYLSSKSIDFSKGIALLESQDIEKIAVANPKTAPYGTAAIEAIKNGGVYEKVEEKFVFAESISQTVTYAITAADIGFIAKSSLYSPKMAAYKENVNWASVEPKLYTPIKQGIVLLKAAGDNPEYRAFYDFILSDTAKTIFKNFGYLVD